MLGEKIKTLRKSQGLNQTEFAKRLGVTSAAVSQWETNSSQPGIDKLMLITREFAIPLDYFSDDPSKNYSETELIKQHLLIELGANQPKTQEARLLAQGVDKMPKAQREQALNIVRAVFTKYADYFEKEDADDT